MKILILSMMALLSYSVYSFEVNLTWQDNSDNEDGFNVFYGTDPNNINEKLITSSGAGTGEYTYTVKDLTYGVTYYFRVNAYNAFGESGFTNTVSAKGTAQDNGGGIDDPATPNRDNPSPPGSIIISAIIENLFSKNQLTQLTKSEAKELDEYLVKMSKNYKESTTYVNNLKETHFQIKNIDDQLIHQEVENLINDYNTIQRNGVQLSFI